MCLKPIFERKQVPLQKLKQYIIHVFIKGEINVDYWSLYLSFKDNTDNESSSIVNRLTEEIKLLSERK